MNELKPFIAAFVVLAVVATIGLVIRQGESIDRLEGRLSAVTAEQRDTAISASQRLEAAVPPGLIAMWSGAGNAIPAGWRLCDGTAGTPDLRGRFVLGSAGDVADAPLTGGGSVILSPDNMPLHSHSLTHDHSDSLAIDPIAHEHALMRTRTDAIGKNYELNKIMRGRDMGLWTGDSLSTGSAELRLSGEIDSFEGNSGDTGLENPVPIEILPRYYKLAFIMKTGK